MYVIIVNQLGCHSYVLISRFLARVIFINFYRRMPCEEKFEENLAGDSHKPMVKRHKLGTTTITSENVGGQKTLGKFTYLCL